MPITGGDWEAYQIEKKPDKWMVCSGENGIDGVARMVDDNQEANAYLIAAAPKMQEALKVADTVVHNAIRYEPTGLYRKQLQQYLIQIREALAKAEGK